MKLLELFEDQQQDDLFRNEATEVFKLIKNIIQSGAEYFDKTSIGPHEKFAVRLRDIPSLSDTYKDLIIIFDSPDSNDGKLFSAKSKTLFALSIGILDNESVSREEALDEIYEKIDRKKYVFVHEFIHYLDTKRAKTLDVDNSRTSALDDNEYFNHPFELNAYYQEAAQAIMDHISSLEMDELNKVHVMEYTKFVNWVFDEFVDQDFINNISEKNKQRLKKRLAMFYEQKVLPYIEAKLSNMD